jgi:hypothetical protein
MNKKGSSCRVIRFRGQDHKKSLEKVSPANVDAVFDRDWNAKKRAVIIGFTQSLFHRKRSLFRLGKQFFRV